MENYIQDIELINNYLNKRPSEGEIQNFENRLKTDSDFNTLFDEHTTFLEGLKRQQLKAEIVKGKQAFIKMKWMKFLGISIAVLTIVSALYFTISNKSTEPIQNENLKNNNVAVDIIPNKKIIEAPIKIDKPIILKDSVSSKKEVVKVEVLKPIKEVETSFIKPPQKLKINTQKDTVIVCKEGTKLIIKANSFVDLNNRNISGVVDIEVTEYYKVSDILLANLSTQSNRKQLETGGMLNIKAKKNDKLLKLKLDTNIEILFPTNNKKEGMQVFTGVWEKDNINWKLQNEEASVEVSEIIDVEVDVYVPFAVVEQVPIFPGCENGDNAQQRECTIEAIQQFVQIKFNTEIAKSIGLTGKQRINTIFKISKEGYIVSIQSRANHPLLEEEANRVISLLPKMIPGKHRGKAVTVPYSLPIIFSGFDTKQNIRTINSSINNRIFDTIHIPIRGEVESIREVMHDKDFEVDSIFIKAWEAYTKSKLIRFVGDRKVILRKPLFEMGNTRFKVLDDDSISRGGHIIRKLWNESQIPTTSRRMRFVPKQQVYIGEEKITEEEFEKRLQNKEDITITTTDVNSYVLRISGLGWINCDRFRNRRSKTIKYKLKIKNAEDTRVSMVFKSFNSILPSWNISGNFDFGTVSKDEEIILVAIKKNNGKLYLSIIDTKTEDNPEIDFNFKEVTIQEMKNELKKLNRLF